MYFVYILRTSSNTLYIGQTNNIEKRLKEHKSKSPQSAKYLRPFKSVELVYSEEYLTREEAMKREYQLKQLTKSQKESLIEENFKVYNKSVKKLYTIWIIPSQSLKIDLDKIVSRLAKKYKSPIFEPHMTLLGDTEIDEKTMIEKAKLLATKLKAFPLELGEISFSTTYFQSVFVRVNCTAKLMEANLKAKEIYKRENNVFMPHMSLLYGDQDMALREKIIPSVKIPKSSKFIVDKIVVVPSTKDPKEWKHLAEIPFTG
jgi:putative endonuclease